MATGAEVLRTGSRRGGAPWRLWPLVAAAVFALALVAWAPRVTTGDAGAAWVLAVVAYVGSHMARAVRLAYLAARPGLTVRRLVGLHWITVGASVLVPFKLGELVRIGLVGAVRRDARDGVVIVWIERALDAAVIAAAVLLSALSGFSTDGLERVLLLTGVFVAATVFAVTALPGNTRDLMLYVARRGDRPSTLPLLRLLRAVLSTVDRVRPLLHRRLAGLLVLTLAVWGLEFAAVRLAFDAVGSSLGESVNALLRVLTGASLDAAPIAPSTLTFLRDLLPGVTPERLEAYHAILVWVPLLGGAVAALALCAATLRGRGR